MSRRDILRRAIRAGLIGGIALIYLSLVGMVEKFDIRNLIDNVVTLGKLLMALPAFLVGYVAVRPRIRRGALEETPAGPAVAIGFGAGLLTGGLTIAALALSDAFPDGAVRSIFVAVSPALHTILTYSKSLPVAAAVLMLGGGILGALGSGFRVLPRTIRRPIATGLIVVFVVAVLQRLANQVLISLGLDTSWLYNITYLGLTKFGAIAVFLGSTAIAALWSAQSPRVRRRIGEMPKEGRTGLSILGMIVLLLVLWRLPFLIGSTLSQVLGTVGIFVLMGLGLNIVVGYAGLLDLGYVAFFAVGAYIAALFTGANLVTSLGETATPAFVLHLNFYAAVPLVILTAAFVGLLIGAPVLRLRGDYLAIVTLGFGEIARVLITSDWLRNALGGAQGLRDVTDAPLAGLSFRSETYFYYLVLAFCLLAVYVSWRLSNSRVGRAWSAMREDEQVAEAMGVSTVKYKLLAFAIGASVGCLSGALFAVKLGSLTPVSFNILVSITALAVIILGGMGSIPGVIVGGLVLIGLPGILSEFEEYRLLLYGGVLVAIMILRPQGLVPNVRRMHELQEEESEQDAWLKGTGEASLEATVAVGSERAGGS
ncbi:MAG TPA: branched-chain amino acid ABC transporter permease [Actinomycetota bacterium]|jgi:branched-chain amino acid transport system permease protein